jgi:predicted GNAT family N-acyltransferase
MSALIVSPSHRRQQAAICWLQQASSKYRAFSRTSGVTNGPGIGFRPIRQRSNQRGALQMHGTNTPASARTHSRSISIRIARDPNDLMLVTAIRAAVYLAEQDCPIEEEFDGNDLVAAHFIGFVGTEPAGCLRVRFFGEFAKVERLAVRHQFRRSRVSFKLVQASVDYIKRKGFRKIYGQAQDRLVDFWAHFGAKPLGHNRKITFSDFSYTEMVLEIEPSANAITLDSDPYVIIRPEGDWDRPGVLDMSSGRAVTSPLRTS